MIPDNLLIHPPYNPELPAHYMSLVFVGDHAERCVMIDAVENPESITFRFRPSDFLRYKYRIKDGDFDDKEKMCVVKSYPKEKCKLMKNKDMELNFWLIFLTYDGRDVDVEG